MVLLLFGNLHFIYYLCIVETCIMASYTNITFPILDAQGNPFHDLVLRKVAVDSVVMSLGDKITGDVYYPTNSLVVTMQEYVEYKGVRYVLVSPPTVVREGLESANSELKGMTKYSFTFYHPMCQLSNLPFTDVAVRADEVKYLSQNSTFAWTGTGIDFIAKLNKNLQGTQWVVVPSDNAESLAKLKSLPDEIEPTKAGQEPNSNVLSFDNATVADAFKTCYDTWKVPFVVDSLHQGEYSYKDEHNVEHDWYNEGKRFVVVFGLPSNEILDANNQPFVFRLGQGLGLKNNSRTPKNNKIVTRISGYGSEDNITYGYPQIVWTGDQTWDFTINNDSTQPNSYPIYDGIVNGARVRLIKHPFTRNVLMPSIYRETLNKKVNPLAQGYDPNIELKDYYDAPISYPNPINLQSPSYQKQGFDGIKPRIGDVALVSVMPYEGIESISKADFHTFIEQQIANSNNQKEKETLEEAYNLWSDEDFNSFSNVGGSYTFSCEFGSVVEYAENSIWRSIKYTSGGANFEFNVYDGSVEPSIATNWDDTYDTEKDEYVQSYFKVRLPALGFDLYACASITQEMKINMRSGACQGCTFPVQVDWEDYKLNFYDSDGNFAPSGSQRDYTKYPDSTAQQITIILKKEIETFGTLMPNVYQNPKANDKFVILGISLPHSYVTNAEALLDETMMQYMLENNIHYFEYPLKFDEHFLTTNQDILAQMRNNTIVRFEYPKGSGIENALYIKQMTVKYGDTPLPQFDITLTDDVEIVLNQIGQTAEEVSRMRVQMNELQKYYGEEIVARINEKLSRVADDVAQGRITFQQGLDTIGDAIIHGNIRSPQFTNGLYTGRGWRIDSLGNAELEALRVRSFLEVVELLINRMQAQEGDTMFTDNDQIEKVDKYVDETDSSVSYVLSLKEKWSGYVTSQMYGNVIKGIINTLAAQQAGVTDTVTTDDYFTSWMRVIATHNTDNTLGVNQIRVVLYGDDETPAQQNFEPCELMTIARWGCIDYNASDSAHYQAEGLDTDAKVRASIKQRQQVFYISTSEGRIVKLNGVDAPILRNGNYGTTLGELPDFVKAYPSVAERLVNGGDYLFAQGVVVGDFIKINKEGLPVPTVVFCGEWVDGSQVQDPEPRNGIYYYNKWNEDEQQYEIHEVRHNGGRWQCLQSQPVMSGGVATYYEPKWNSPYWALVDGNDNLTIEFVSSKGYSFRRGHVDTVITPHLFYGNVDISDDVAAEFWNWTRESESGKTLQDETWDAQHQHMKQIHLTNLDMPATWSTQDKAIFTCTVTLNDGKTTRIVDNQIIS